MYFRVPDPRRLLIAAIILFGYVILYTFLIFILNGGAPNRILTPLPQYYSLFAALWDENAWAAFLLMIKKSFFIIAHKDPRSGLNLWTMDLDSITFIVYLTIAWLLSGRLKLKRENQEKAMKRLSLASAFAGSALIFFSISYMSVVDHCAGPTWAGFVALYGMGASEFQLYPAYQFGLAGIGVGLLFLSVWIDRRFGVGGKPPRHSGLEAELSANT